MENVFSTPIKVNNKEVLYHIIFEDEKYTFHADVEDAEIPSFSFHRENNQWIDEDCIDLKLRAQAAEALEKYLLSQH
ncbi:MAG: hypothetical protein JWQ96_1468 [Segetibacter sp.]|nr:hypothetical protein [Segetibacter sp.]